MGGVGIWLAWSRKKGGGRYASRRRGGAGGVCRASGGGGGGTKVLGKEEQWDVGEGVGRSKQGLPGRKDGTGLQEVKNGEAWIRVTRRKQALC